MILASGKVQEPKSRHLYPQIDNMAYTLSSKHYNESGNKMKPLLFNPRENLKTYIEAGETAKTMFRHLSADKVTLILTMIMHEDELFNQPTPRDVYIRLLKLLNPKTDISTIIPLVSDKISEALSSRTEDNSCDLSVLLLNEAIDDLQIPHLKHLSQAVKNEDFFKAGCSFDGRINNERMDDLSVCMYAFKNKDWVAKLDFSNSSRLKEDEWKDANVWLENNYDFIYRLLMTYYNPTEYMEFSKTRGFGFTAFVSLLHMIKDRVDLSYWDFNADLWINLNLIGYNPYKEISKMDKRLNTIYGKKLLSKLNSSQVVNFFVSVVNNQFIRFGKKASSAFKSPNNCMYYFKQPLEVYGNMIGNYDSVSTIKTRLAALGHNNVAKDFDFDQVSTVDTFITEYTFSVDSFDMCDRPAALAFGYLPAFLSRHKLNFSELSIRDYISIEKPKLFDFFQYLYMHRGWLGKRHNTSIGRGRTVEIHAHTAVFDIYNNWDDRCDEWSFKSSPMETFKIGFTKASKQQAERMDGEDFDNLPVDLLPALDDRFFHIRNPYDLITEGNIMNHCCGGSHYIEECEDEERVFFHFQPDDSEHYSEGVTFDLLIDENSKDVYRLSSANMHSNDSVSSESMKEIKDFINRLNKLCRNRHISDSTDQLAKAC